MCGIVASYRSDANADSTLDSTSPETLRESLCNAAKILHHRGPDDIGVYVSDTGHAGLGHARLSIIDIENGHQPLRSLDGTVNVVVNGELYDYKQLRAELEEAGCIFQTSSDSELIIHLYQTRGQNLLNDLRGEFAFVLYDSRRDIIFAARDRFGIKPCFYTVIEGRLLIASEIKAFKSLGWKAAWDVDSIVNMGDYTDDRTVFRGVHKLPAAHCLTFNRAGRLKVETYWEQSFRDRNLVETRSIEEMIAGVRERLIASVKARLRSDVPLAILLSGGLDSCSVAGIAAHLLKEIDPSATLETFTLSFPDRPDLDEGPTARRMAASIGAKAHMVTPTEDQLISYFERSVYMTEMPISTLHCAGKIILSEHVRDRGFKVVLTGEGSDELFAGYAYYLVDYLRSVDDSARFLGVPLPTQPELDILLRDFEANRFPQDHASLGQVRFDDAVLSRSLLGGIWFHRFLAAQCVTENIFSEAVLKRYGPQDHTRTIAEGFLAASRLKMAKNVWHPLDVALYTGCHSLLPNLILNIVGDRPEMANSIEGRPPFLDHTLAEYAQQLPPSMKLFPRRVVRDGHTTWEFTEKYIVREAVKPFVTPEVYNRRKAQYNVPLPRHDSKSPSERLSPLQEYVKRRITKEAVEKLSWANWTFIGGLLDEYLVSPATPADGGLDKRARYLLNVLSYVVLQEQFDIPPLAF